MMRKEFSVYEINDTALERPVLIKETAMHLYTFSGTRINRTLNLLFNHVKLIHSWNDANSLFEFNGTSKQEFSNKWALLSDSFTNVDSLVSNALESNPTLLDFSKWGAFLPIGFQISLLKEKFYDFVNTERFVKSIRIVYNK